MQSSEVKQAFEKRRKKENARQMKGNYRFIYLII